LLDKARRQLNRTTAAAKKSLHNAVKDSEKKLRAMDKSVSEDLAKLQKAGAAKVASAKAAVKKVTAKKAAPRKPVAKKTAAPKPAAKKAAPRKAAPRKATAG